MSQANNFFVQRTKSFSSCLLCTLTFHREIFNVIFVFTCINRLDLKEKNWKKILHVGAGELTFLMDFVTVEIVGKSCPREKLSQESPTRKLCLNFLMLTKISISGEGLNLPGRLSVLELQSAVLSAVSRGH